MRLLHVARREAKRGLKALELIGFLRGDGVIDVDRRHRPGEEADADGAGIVSANVKLPECGDD
jgi:hypothetical protein